MKKEFRITMATLLMTSLFGCSSASSTASSSAGGDMYHVTIVKQLDHASLDEIANAITARLDEIAKENNVTIEYGEVYSGQNDQATIRQITDQAVNDGADAIIPIATMAAQTAVTSSLGTDTKVVFAAVSDPISAELTDLDNVTGTSDALNTEVIFEMMKKVDPELSKVGLLYSLSEINSETPIKEAIAYCEANNIEYVQATGNTNDEVISAASALISENVDAIFTPTDNVVMASELAIAPLFAQKGIAHYTGADSFVRNGGFATCGVNYTELGKRTAELAYEAIINGTEGLEDFYLMDGGIVTVNSETAAQIGIETDVFAEFGEVVEVMTTEE